jgi:long-subunit fatty acid transport protein
VAAYFPEDAPSRYMLTEGLYTAGVASLSGAYRLLDWLDLGASLGLFYLRLDGQRWINQALPDAGDLNADVVVRMVGEDYRFYFNAGVCVRLLPGLTLGLSFTSGSEVDLVGKLEVSLPPGWEEDELVKALVDAEILKPGRYAMHTRMSVPYGIAAGLNWEALEELELSADFRYWFYQTYEQMDIFHDFSIDLGTEEPLVPNPMTFEKQYRGSWSVSLGVLGRPFAIPLELMAGWNYKLSPSPSRTKSLDSPEMTSTGASLGLRYTFWETFRVSATYFRYWFLNYDVPDSMLEPPQNIRFTGGLNTFSVVLELML